MTSAILNHLHSLGYAVSEERHAGRVVFTAARVEFKHVASCDEGELTEHAAVCAIAEACGVDLEDG